MSDVGHGEERQPRGQSSYDGALVERLEVAVLVDRLDRLAALHDRPVQAGAAVVGLEVPVAVVEREQRGGPGDAPDAVQDARDGLGGQVGRHEFPGP